MTSNAREGGRSRPGQRGARAVAVFAAATAFACSSPQLVPVSPAADGAARVEAAGIRVEVGPDEGGLPQYLPPDVEALRVSIHNGSDRGIHVDVDAIQLTDGNQGTVAALIPGSIEPRPHVSGVGLDPASPFSQPLPGPPPVDLRLSTLYPAQYRELAFGDTSAEARRAEIVSRAFASGFIDSGQTREGFVYFDTPPEDVKRMNLIIPVHPGQGSGAVTTITVPLIVES